MIDLKETRDYLRILKCHLKEHGVEEARHELDTHMLHAELGRKGEDKPFPVSLGTFFLDDNDYKKAKRDARLIISAALKVRKAYVEGDKKVQEYITLSRSEKALLKNESPNLDTFGVIRFDFFPTKKGWMVTEFNADNPDIIMVCNEAIKRYQKHILHIAAHKHIRPPKDNAKLMDQLLTHTAENPISSIGIIGPLDRWIIGENNQSVAGLEARGYTAVTGNLEDVTVAGEKVKVNGVKVDVLRRVAETHFFVDHKKDIPQLLKALKSNNIRMANALWDRLLGHKSLYHIFTDRSFDYLFNVEETEVLHRTVPWTRLLIDKKTHLKRKGSINLKSYAIKEKNNLVLKPAGGAEARGVFIGSELTNKEWKEALDKAFKKPKAWILQERIFAKPIPVLVDNGKKTNIKNATADISLHAFATDHGIKFGLIFSRYAFGAINNIISGGGIIFPFVLKKRWWKRLFK